MGGDRVAITVAPIIFAAVLVAVMQSADAKTYKVGGDSVGWTNQGDPSFYSNWASGNTFNLNDVLEFDFSAGAHTVAQVSKDAYDSCDTTSNPISFWTSGPASVTLNSTDSFYFFCTIASHCAGGQKLSVQVSTSSGTPSPPTSGTPSPPTSGTPSPPTSGTPSPPTSGTSTPPPPPPPSSSSASSLTAVAATSVVFGLVYVVGLMN